MTTARRGLLRTMSTRAGHAATFQWPRSPRHGQRGTKSRESCKRASQVSIAVDQAGGLGGLARVLTVHTGVVPVPGRDELNTLLARWTRTVEGEREGTH